MSETCPSRGEDGLGLAGQEALQAGDGSLESQDKLRVQSDGRQEGFLNVPELWYFLCISP